MFPWPKAEITDYERSRGLREYKEPILDANGQQTGKWNELYIRRRTYVARMGQAGGPAGGGDALPATGIWSGVTMQAFVQVSRAARIFGLTFIGRADNIRLRIRTGTGTELTPSGDDGLGPVVSSMLPGSGLLSTAGDTVLVPRQRALGPLLIDPNWQLLPNEKLFFFATLVDEDDPDVQVLGVGVHVWELPTYQSDGV